jgi:cytochrome c biogenesis factor
VKRIALHGSAWLTTVFTQVGWPAVAGNVVWTLGDLFFADKIGPICLVALLAVWLVLQCADSRKEDTVSILQGILESVAIAIVVYLCHALSPTNGLPSPLAVPLGVLHTLLGVDNLLILCRERGSYSFMAPDAFRRLFMFIVLLVAGVLVGALGERTVADVGQGVALCITGSVLVLWTVMIFSYPRAGS